MLHFILLVLGKTTPLLLAGLGGLFSEVSGIINFALEGMMLVGAFGAMWATYATGSPWAGLLGGAAGGALVGLLHALASVKFRSNQIVSSISLNLLAAGTTGMLLNQVFGIYGTSPAVNGLPEFHGVSALTPLALCLAGGIMALFRWSRWGLDLRACGENPAAASAAGLSVTRIRFLSITAGGVLAGLGGAYLSIGELSQFVENMTQGRGYLAIAALILGRWTPLGVLLASLLFGTGGAFSEWLAVRWPNLPPQTFLAFPYLICFTVLMFRIGSRKPPSALGKLA